MGPLRHLAEALGLTEPGGGDARYLDLIGQLQAHHLLYWDVDTASYKSDPAVRQLLAYSLELDDGEQFRRAHLAAYQYHRDHLERHPQYLARYVPEAAYHGAILAQGRSLPDGVPSFGGWWAQFSPSQAPRYAEAWHELAATLEKDDELSQVLSADEYERLSSEAQEHAAAG